MNSQAPRMIQELPNRTKIVATVGPACSDLETLTKLIESGVSVFRLNFSHGDLETQAKRVSLIREAATLVDRPIALMGDLQGPKIRVGQVPSPGLEVRKGTNVIFHRESLDAHADGDVCHLSCTYQGLVDDVLPGQRLLVNDGAVRMLILEKRSDEIECSVTTGGLITTGKGINLPESDLNVEVLGTRDWSHVDWAIEQELDGLAMSFVRRAEDIIELDEGIKSRLASRGGKMSRLPIVAKIELPKAVENIVSILKVADAIMVARGDLGVELDLARVPIVQKQLLQTAHDYGRPVIVATQMLETMIHAPIPTRAEATDVACAIVDETDATMLSGETAVGEYPVLAVETMRRITQHTEEYLEQHPAPETPPLYLPESDFWTAALAHGVWTIATDIQAKFIIVWTRKGHGARFLSQNTFHVPIIAATPEAHVARQLQFFRGVIPIHCAEEPDSLGDLARWIDDWLIEKGWAQEGDSSVLVTGGSIGRDTTPNRLAIHAIGQSH
ncbi:MAG: pyruvate kinase [Planctomycetota bacterium]|nr:pyruvate kinase [Planctomycetota bacterium]